ncbi:hypothetical protein M2D07_024255 [Pseudomonas sp. BGr12]|uniref:hypothetical protein n=1 Tax=unclassified Pseudomonas TaxID=196821 RepID=UPI001783E92A|nr:MULTISPECIES: hypothetical protein [unclassified Pseudomonas]MBD9501240.1 hypothetical protein [Pseudomonas sp. PDM17]MDL2430151.1 hypothetical protein [Pseudomonas sp. BJa5]
MKRRSMVLGMGIGVFAGAAGGLAGFTLGVRSTEKSLDLQAFLQRNVGVKFHHLPTALLLKLYSRRLTDADRMALVHDLVHHNSALFVADPYERSLGTPGFYRVVS